MWVILLLPRRKDYSAYDVGRLKLDTYELREREQKIRFVYINYDRKLGKKIARPIRFVCKDQYVCLTNGRIL